MELSQRLTQEWLEDSQGARAAIATGVLQTPQNSGSSKLVHDHAYSRKLRFQPVYLKIF